MLESWRWLHSLHSTPLSREVDWTQLEWAIDAVVAKIPELAGIKDAAPDATFRTVGRNPAQELHRYSGRTAMRASISAFMSRVSRRILTPCSPSMEQPKPIPRNRHLQVPFAWPAELPAGVEQIPGRSWRQTALWRSGRASV